MKHTIERPKTSLQIEEAIDLHITGWTIQRTGWVVMFLFLLAAALGLFGDGVLSKRITSRDGTTVIYERFARYQSDTEVEVQAESVNGRIRINVPGNFIDSYKIERITPEPQTREINNANTQFVFAAQGQGRVIFFLSARKKGSFEYRFSINDTEFVLDNYIFP